MSDSLGKFDPKSTHLKAFEVFVFILPLLMFFVSAGLTFALLVWINAHYSLPDLVFLAPFVIALATAIAFERYARHLLNRSRGSEFWK